MTSPTRHPEQVARDLEELDRRRFKSLLAFAACCVYIVAVSATGGDFRIFVLSRGAVLLLGVGMVLLAMIVSAVYWRCPVCNRLLGRELYPKFCPECGTRLSAPDSESGIGVPPDFAASSEGSIFSSPDDAIEEFQRRRYRALLASVPAVLVVLGLFVRGGEQEGFLGLELREVQALMIGTVVLSGVAMFLWWRCPFCRKDPSEGLNPRRCENCGAKLRRD
jgi:rubrerythrin